MLAMLSKEHYKAMKIVLDHTSNRDEIKRVAMAIRNELNPHPSGQIEHNTSK